MDVYRERDYYFPTELRLLSRTPRETTMFDYAEPTVLLAINAAVAYNEDAGSLHNPKIANACVEQRDDIVTMIAAAEDAESLYAVERILRFASNLWHAVGYGYKASELRLRIKARAELLTRRAS